MPKSTLHVEPDKEAVRSDDVSKGSLVVNVHKRIIVPLVTWSECHLDGESITKPAGRQA